MIVREDFTFRSRDVKLAGDISYVDGTKCRLLIVLPGWDSSKDRQTYEGIKEIGVEKGYFVAKMDFHGQGKSDGDIEECTIPLMTNNLEDFVSYLYENYSDHISQGKLTIVASSLAGEIALNYAFKYQEKLESLVLSCPGLGQNISETENNGKRRNYWDSILDFTGMSLADYFEKLKKIKLPIRIIHGEEDERIPMSQPTELLEYLPHATMDMISGMKHRPESERQREERLRYINKYL